MCYMMLGYTKAQPIRLLRYSEAIFMQVDINQASNNRWLTVRVSDIYKQDDPVSVVHGLLTLFQASKVADDSKRMQLSDIATRLMTCTAHRYSSATEKVELNDSRGSNAIERSMNELVLTSSERTKLQSALRGETLLVLNPGDLVRFFLVNCRGCLGRGRSGYVVLSCLEGVDFEVKRWNRYDR